jgi:transposase
VLKTGCQWSMLPRDFVPKSTAHDALARWTEQGLWPRINEALRTKTRLYEKNPCHHEAFVYLAFIGIMTQRLTALQPVELFAG